MNPVTKSDAHFLKTFSLLIVGMMVFSLILVLGAMVLHQRWAHSESTMRAAAVEARIRPVGGVYSGETGRAAQLAAQEAARAAMSSRVAFEGSLDGGLIYERVCAACHTGGVGGAPRMDDRSLWTARIDQGEDVLLRHAIEGYQGPSGLMPARGGRLDLSDEQVKASIDHMLSMLPSP